jgi:hypothetical protein
MISGIAAVDVTDVENALLDYAMQKSGSLKALSSDAEGNDVLVIAQSPEGNVTVLFPDSYAQWHDASVHLSRSLEKPVLSLHVHDGDFWMYVLLVDGKEVDRFNPIPDYWEEQSDAENLTWTGSARTVSNYWPNVHPDQIQNYLVRWDREDADAPKAYPDDEFGIGEDWQITDFMRSVGLVYPIGDDGVSTGSKFNLLEK